MSEGNAGRCWFRFGLRTMFVAVTICAAASPFLPQVAFRIGAWWNPPKKPGTLLMVTPSGGRHEGKWMNEDDETLTHPIP